MIAIPKSTRSWLAPLAFAVLIPWSVPAAASTFVDGEFATYSQNIWGADPTDGPPASILKARFFDLFTAGAEFGYPFPGGAVMDFSSADAMLTFLPQVGAPAALNSSLTDPTTTSAGVFGGQVVALDLNIGLSDLGALEHPAGVSFGDLVLTGYSGTLAGLNGHTVREYYQIVDAALGGGFEPFSIIDLAGQTNAINSSFGGGFVSDYAQQHYELPNVVPEPSTWVLVLAALGGLGISGLRLRRVAGRPARTWCAALVLGAAAGLLPLWAHAHEALLIKPLAQAKVTALPEGTLFWRIENFASVAQAKAAAGPWSLVVEAADKVWLFTLGPGGSASPGAAKVAEVGPIPRVTAQEYLLRINDVRGSPGSVTPVHSHPGSEAFYVLGGEQSIRSARGVLKVHPGQAEAGQGADMAMQVSSSGTEDLHALVMFVVDANRPFSVPATVP